MPGNAPQALDMAPVAMDHGLLMDNFYLRSGPRAFRPRDPRLRALVRLCRGPCVLDVGCGPGDLLLLLQEDDPGLVLAGTEISRVALGVCLGRGVRAGLYWTDTVPPGPWNTIVMGQVLEHLRNDRGMVEAAGRELVPGGRLVVSVPNRGAVQSPDHVREYSAMSLRALLRRAGTVHQYHWGGEETRLIMWAERGTE